MRGFTLVEVFISVVVAALIAAAILSALSSFRISADLNLGVDSVLFQLREARRRTIESQGGSQWGVHTEGTEMALFKGSAYSSGDPKNETFVLPASITIAGPSDIVFKRISGEALSTGTFVLSSTRDASKMKTIVIYASGLAEIQ